MSRAEATLVAALKSLPPKPSAKSEGSEAEKEKARSSKKRYSEEMSRVVAAALAQELRDRGLKNARPGGVGEVGTSGAERQMSGGIGAKKVDVTWATEESGLLLAISVKTINFPNFQKNLTNRRGDMLFEAVTLHRRFPYAVLGGFFVLDKGANADGTRNRASTFLNAHRKLRLFTGRTDPAARDEQYEHLFVVLVEASPFACSFEIFEAGKPHELVTLDQALDILLRTVVDRDPDFYTLVGPDGTQEPGENVSPVSLRKTGSFSASKKASTTTKKIERSPEPPSG